MYNIHIMNIKEYLIIYSYSCLLNTFKTFHKFFEHFPLPWIYCSDALPIFDFKLFSYRCVHLYRG